MCDENDILNAFTNASVSYDDTLDSNRSGITANLSACLNNSLGTNSEVTEEGNIYILSDISEMQLFEHIRSHNQ